MKRAVIVWTLLVAFCAGASGHDPEGGVISPCQEYQWMKGILLRWGEDWTDIIIDLAVAAADDANDSTAFVMVQGNAQQMVASAVLTAAGADMNRVEFIKAKSDSSWIGEYGPHFIWLDSVRAVVDSEYFTVRPQDNAIPMKFAKFWNMPFYDMPMMCSEGNILSTSNRHLFLTDAIQEKNPDLSMSQIEEMLKKFMGAEAFHLFSAFPASIDATGNINNWMLILSDNEVLIGEYASSAPDYPPYVITEDAKTYMQNLGFTVHRVPALNDGPGGYGSNHYTYTNAILLNNKILVPQYGGAHASMDAAALQAYQAALPGHAVKGVDCASLVWTGGGLCSISMQVPAYTESMPAAKVLCPNGGELWGAEFPRDITWAAEDDDEVAAVDIYASPDGGATFPYIVALGEDHDGLFEGWVPPWIRSKDCVVKVVARDAGFNEGIDQSDASCTTEFMEASTYDFSSNAGVDRWAFGTSSISWDEDLEGNLAPPDCATEVNQVQADAYNRLAYSDAAGGPTSLQRYWNPAPGGLNESTLIARFQIREKRAYVRSLEFLWEGFAADTQPMKLYVWDHAAGNWSDGKKAFGEEHYMEYASHKNDRVMRGVIIDSVKDYISPGREVFFLIYCGKNNRATYHDYMSLTVQSMPFQVKSKSM